MSRSNAPNGPPGSAQRPPAPQWQQRPATAEDAYADPYAQVPQQSAPQQPAPFQNNGYAPQGPPQQPQYQTPASAAEWQQPAGSQGYVPQRPAQQQAPAQSSYYYPQDAAGAEHAGSSYAPQPPGADLGALRRAEAAYAPRAGQPDLSMEYRTPAAPQASAQSRYAPANYPPEPVSQPPQTYVSQPHAPQQQWPGSNDPRYGLDVAQYAQAPSAGQLQAARAASQPVRQMPPTQPGYPDEPQQPAWGNAPARPASVPYPHQDPQQGRGEPSLDHGRYGVDRTAANPPVSAQLPAHGYARADHSDPRLDREPIADQGAEEYEDEEFEEEEPRRSRRGLVVVAALVGAIGLGGGLAYAYKVFGNSAAGGKPPLVKADAQPARTKPAIPGGKEFPNGDAKVLGRLGEAGSSAQQGQQVASSGATLADEGGPRKVPTQVIPGPGAAQALPGGARGVQAPSVPGMLVDTPGPPLGQRPLPPVVPQQQALAPAALPAQAVVAPAAAPRVPIQKAPPPAAPVAATVAAAEVVPAPPAKKKPAPKAVVAKPLEPAADGAAPAVQVTASAGANGFVAVLSSQKSRMDALKVYADLQQKYGDVLSNKLADVQESDQTARGMGTVYRAVVGPPGSKASADSVCSQLKSAGYTNCWVTAY